jgi:hypothetical protein
MFVRADVFINRVNRTDSYYCTWYKRWQKDSKFQNCPLFLFVKNLNRDEKKRLMDGHPNYEQQQKLPLSTQQPKPLLFVVNAIVQPSVSFSLHMIVAPTCPHMMQLFSSF